MPNQFKNPGLRKQYDVAAGAYDKGSSELFWVDGSAVRGSPMAQAFWDGFDGEGASDFVDAASRSTEKYAWWRAGQDAKRTADAHPIHE